MADSTVPSPVLRPQAKEALTQACHNIQKPDLLSGLSRNYKAKDEMGETLPPENKIVQTKVTDVIETISKSLVEMLTLLADRQYATLANAIVSVGFTPAGRHLTAT